MQYMDLKAIVNQLEEAAKLIPMEDEIRKYNFDRLPVAQHWICANPYYKMLAAYCKLFNVINALDLGTYYGWSAIAMGMYAEHVDSYDIECKLLDNKMREHNITFHILGHGDDVTRLDFNKYNTIFIDIGMHGGIYEDMIHQRLHNEKYNGIVFYDDICWKAMQPVWRAIPEEKVETNWHGTDGFGVVKYGN